MKSWAIGTLLATLALFVWGMVFWLSPLSQPAFHPLPDDRPVAEALTRYLPADGTYYIPSEKAEETWMQQHREGPIATVFFQREGADPGNAGVLLKGFFHMLVTVGLFGLALRRVAPALPTYGTRVAFVVLVGVAFALWSNVGYTIWWWHPWSLHLVNLVYDVTGWSLVAFILARFIKAETHTTLR
jgi:hypothetical protein